MQVCRDYVSTAAGAAIIANGAAPLAPLTVSAVSAWLRLQASSQSGGEWANWVDVLNSNPGAINSARRPAVAAAANGFPLANFQTNDCVAWSIAASNFNISTFGIYLDVSPDATAGVQILWSIAPGTNGSNHRAITTYFSGTSWIVDCYITDANGRQFTFNSAAAAGTNKRYGIEYDSTVGGDGCLTATINGAIQTANSTANIGAGGTLGAFQAQVGNLLLGNFNDGAASSPLSGKQGPNVFALTSKMAGASSGLLTTAGRAALAGFEVPT